MTSVQPPSLWTPLALLQKRFDGNLTALASRYPGVADALKFLIPAQTYFIQPVADSLILGTGTPGQVQPLPQSLPPAAVRNLVAKTFPDRVCNQPVVIIGEDMGWLWESVYRVACSVPMLPGYRPPLFFLIKDLERLWVMLHIQDWQALLADARVRLFAGAGAFEDFRQSLLDDVMCPWPKVAITIDPSVWPAGMNIDAMLAEARVGMSKKLADVNQLVTHIYAGMSADSIAANFLSEKPLRVLGITSRYTSFLQYSMRDWLDAFARMGHQTQLFIEPNDYQTPNNLAVAGACAEFRPDLVLVIDHFRQDISGLPENVPVVMWVQDLLPSIFDDKAGAAQGPRDFCVGFGRLQLSQRHGYPARRFLSANMGVNIHRFAPAELTESEQRQFGCDVSYVSHASTPAEVLLQRLVDRTDSPQGTRLFRDMYDRLQAHYESGGPALDEPVLNKMMADSMASSRSNCEGETYGQVFNFFFYTLNNAIFRHQTLRWISELGVDLRIYGKGWDQHPQLARHARGVADNRTNLRTIYQASRINLQVTASGAVHQRLLDGLAAGGFFLVRYSIGDAVGVWYQKLWNWCRQNDVCSEEQLRARADHVAGEIIGAINQIMGYDTARADLKLYDMIETHADSDFMNTATSIWSEYDQISFDSKDQLRGRLATYLSDVSARERIVTSMRRQVIERASYERINQRLLNMIARSMSSSPSGNTNLNTAA